MEIKIKELRKRMNMSQNAFSGYFGIPPNTIRHWEQGVNKPPEYVVRMLEQLIQIDESAREVRAMQLDKEGLNELCCTIRHSDMPKPSQDILISFVEEKIRHLEHLNFEKR